MPRVQGDGTLISAASLMAAARQRFENPGSWAFAQDDHKTEVLIRRRGRLHAEDRRQTAAGAVVEGNVDEAVGALAEFAYAAES